MSAPRVKFRCVHCNRLLSTSVSRIGKAIACPKCVQAVTVPALGAGAEIESSAEPQPALIPPTKASSDDLSPDPIEESQAKLPDFMAEIAAAIPDEVLAIQPEDIRAELPLLNIRLGKNENLEHSPRSSQPEQSVEPRDPESSDRANAVSQETIRVEAWLNPGESNGAAEPVEPVILPSIEVATSPEVSISREPTVRRSGDVTLPASVVLSWSLFVLLAQALAFLAGLFIGHYYWKHP